MGVTCLHGFAEMGARDPLASRPGYVEPLEANVCFTVMETQQGIYRQEFSI